MSNEQLLLQYLRSIEDSVKRIEVDLSSKLADMGQDVDSHDTRLDDLEKHNANISGKITMAGAIITALAGLVAWFVSFFKT